MNDGPARSALVGPPPDEASTSQQKMNDDNEDVTDHERTPLLPASAVPVMVRPGRNRGRSESTRGQVERKPATRPNVVQSAGSVHAARAHLRRYGTSGDQQQYDKHGRKKKKGSLRSQLLTGFIAVLLVICIYASFRDDFLDEVEADISCATCIGLLVPLQALASVGDDAFVNFFTSWCINLGIEDEDVCRGAVGQQAPILAHDLRSISLASHAAKNFCSTIFGLCPLQKVVPHVVPFNDTTTTTDLVRKKPKEWKSKGRKPFQIVHISDVHIDRQYVEGSEALCSKVICCRDYGRISPNISIPAGRFGNKHCDTPDALVRSMFEAINHFAPEKHMTIFTGDVVEAAVWLVNRDSVSNDLTLWFEEMQFPSYPAFGNHDVAPVNAFPRNTSTKAPDIQWVYDLTAQKWQKWIGHKAAKQVRENFGCYSRVHPGTRLRIISLNTQYWLKQNFWLYDHDRPQWDPNGILTWLKHELHDAEQLGQRAWIIGHMSFGKVDAMRDQSNYANQIFQRYHNTIAAHFYGHSHVDEFEIAYSNYDNRTAESANGIAFISGALAPSSGNPVFRVYDIDPDTYEVMDFRPYYTNKTEPAFQVDPVWREYYSARESYGAMVEPRLAPTDSLNASFWHRVTEKMEHDNRVFQLFNTRLSRGGKVEHCDTALCKNNTICMLRAMRSESNCAFIQPGFSFRDRKRDTEAVTEPSPVDDDDAEQTLLRLNRWHACEGSGLASMFRKIGNGVMKKDPDFTSLFTLAHQEAGLYARRRTRGTPRLSIDV